MLFKTWKSRRTSQAARGCARRSRLGRGYRPALEPLEDRTLLASGASQIAFFSDRDSAQAMYVQPADGSGPAARVLTVGYPMGPVAWLRDGRVVLVAIRPGTRGDIGVWTPGDTVPRWIAASTFGEVAPAVSSDARWIAYASNRSGQFEVYVQALSG